MVGFELSECCKLLLEALSSRRYNFKQFILNPKQFSVPNERPRYYLIAERQNSIRYIPFENEKNSILTCMPGADMWPNTPNTLPLEKYLDQLMSAEELV